MESGSKLSLLKIEKYKSILLVSAQFICIGALLPGIRFTGFSVVTTLCFLFSLTLLVWSLLTMSTSKLKIFPEPHRAASLVTSGPYKFIRHPMYTSVLFGSAGLVAMNFSWIRLAFFIILLIVLIYKLRFEEKLLSEKFESYKQYSDSTFRLVPFIY